MNLKSILNLFRSKDPAYYNDFYINYTKSYKKPNLNAEIASQEFVVFDTETTGLDPQNSKILSIGAIKCDYQNMYVHDVMSIFLKQEVLHTEDAVAIHGIVSRDDNNINESIAIKMFYDFVGQSILVGHHVHFDILMIENAAKKHGGGKLLNQSLDTSYIAKRIDNPYHPLSQSPNKYTLDALCTRYGIEMKARHTADGDAYLTALLFMKLLNQLDKKGIKTVKDLIHP